MYTYISMYIYVYIYIYIFKWVSRSHVLSMGVTVHLTPRSPIFPGKWPRRVSWWSLLPLSRVTDHLWHEAMQYWYNIDINIDIDIDNIDIHIDIHRYTYRYTYRYRCRCTYIALISMNQKAILYIIVRCMRCWISIWRRGISDHLPLQMLVERMCLKTIFWTVKCWN